ncbi:MAG: TIGR00300 family protein [Ktedonobacterales bacterium]|nr:TIGR00300 family protein [Ktedonobacterales bacterium]
MASHEIELHGHIIDSLILPRIWDTIMRASATFQVQEMHIGVSATEPSHARMTVSAATQAALDDLLGDLEQLGAEIVGAPDAQTHVVEQDGVLPDDFYATTNLPTDVRVAGEWLPVADIEMDVAIIIDPATLAARCLPMHQVRVGDAVVVGHGGIRVHPLERTRATEDVFSFMQNSVSSERSKGLVIADIAREMRAAHGRGGKILLVLGPAVVHTGARRYVAELIALGYVQVIFAGNAVAAHDTEAAMFGTSLGVDLQTGDPVQDGHRHHLRAINAVRRLGGLRAAVAAGVVTEGIIAEAIRHDVELVLAGSIRDDGPIPDVITDMIVAQERMRAAARGVDVALMLASMLHGIATGNLLPATVRTVVVDINPAVVTKLADRGTTQAIGLVTDTELFLRELVEHLRD